MEYNSEFQRWLNHPNIDKNLKEQLLNMSEEEIKDAFYTNIEFGTAGMRGVLGVGTNRINIHTIRKATQGFSQYIINNGKEAMDKGVAISCDNRHMSYEFAIDCANLLAYNNIKSYIFDSLRPTPELSFAVRELNCFGGIMITASHNPKEYNGYKLYDDKGCQLVPSLAEMVINEVNSIEDELGIKYDLSDEQKKLITVIGSEIDEKYYDNVKSIQLNKDIKKDIKVVFSSEHGTSYIPVTTILKDCGYNVIPVVEQSSFDPDFSNTKSPNPEELKAYELALKYAKDNDADLILVCDPDADRMGVGVKHDGEYIILTGNQSGALLIEYILSQLNEKNLLPKNPVMFNTVVTSDIGEKVASKYNVSTEKTLTGFKFIGEKVAKYEINKEKNYVFGYEESYGSLIKPFVRDKDAPQACLLLSEACAYYKEKGKDLYDVLLDLYDEFGYYNDSQTSIKLEGADGALKMKNLSKSLREDRLKEISGVKVIKWEDFEDQIYFDNGVKELKGYSKSNVLKYYLEDGSWIAIRPSGTEPKIKVYYCIKGIDETDSNLKLKTYDEFFLKLLV